MTKLNEKKLKESYSYSDVPLQTVVSLRRAPSKGTYFNQSIAKIYKYKKIS